MIGTTLPQLAGRSTVGSLFRERARLHPDRCAVEAGGSTLTYGELNQRVNRAVEVLRNFGVARGDRVALLSENRPEYLQLELACAKLGAILACQNWRLAPRELKHCIGLVSPKVVVVSERHAHGGKPPRGPPQRPRPGRLAPRHRHDGQKSNGKNQVAHR